VGAAPAVLLRFSCGRAAGSVDALFDNGPAAAAKGRSFNGAPNKVPLKVRSSQTCAEGQRAGPGSARGKQHWLGQGGRLLGPFPVHRSSARGSKDAPSAVCRRSMGLELFSSRSSTNKLEEEGATSTHQSSRRRKMSRKEKSVRKSRDIPNWGRHSRATRMRMLKNRSLPSPCTASQCRPFEGGLLEGKAFSCNPLVVRGVSIADFDGDQMDVARSALCFRKSDGRKRSACWMIYVDENKQSLSPALASPSSSPRRETLVFGNLLT